MSCQLHNDSEISSLCRHCRLLVIDDKAWGGYSSNGPRESKFLVVDKEDNSRHFETGYRFQDLYPHLPSLAQSALAGCVCCAQIREAILAAKLEPPEGAASVILLISYRWKMLGNDLYSGDLVFVPERGLAAMLLQVNFMSITGQEPLSRPVISFNIDSKSGTFRLRCHDFCSSPR